MRKTLDTTGDDPAQGKAAKAALAEAERVAIPTPVLCEFVWVLARGYGVPADQIGDCIRRLIDSDRVETDRAAVESGLTLLDAGGGFADGVIAFEGAALGGEVFLSFDRDTVKQLKQNGWPAKMLA